MIVQVAYQADEDKKKLDDVGVGHRVEASQKRVEDGDGGGDPDAPCIGQIQDHAHGSSCRQEQKKCAGGNISQTTRSFYFFLKKEKNTPNAIIVVGKQTTSLNREAKVSPTVTTLPYFAWKGSNNVTHRLSLIGLANKNPPEDQDPPKYLNYC